MKLFEKTRWTDFGTFTLKFAIIFLVACTFNTKAFCWNGSGTEEDPYQIGSLADITELANNVNNGVSTYSGEYFKITANISNVTKPIGMGKWEGGNLVFRYFSGNIDGDGHTITLNIPEIMYTRHSALIGYMKGSATIKNLTVDGNVVGNFASAGIVAYIESNDSDSFNFINCHNKANINVRYNDYGGIIGGFYGKGSLTISDCSNDGSITSIDGVFGNIGGILGFCQNGNVTINNCTNSGEINCPKSQQIGGIVGNIGLMNKESMSNFITNCTNTASINGLFRLGGIAGYIKYTTINKCESKATNIIANKTYAGGIVAEADVNSIIRNCINKTDIVYKYDGDYYYEHIGGIVGKANNAIIENCYNIASVTAENAYYVGGIVGKTDNVTINNCYNGGKVVGTTKDGLDYTSVLIGQYSGGTYTNLFSRCDDGSCSNIYAYKSNTPSTIENCKFFKHPSETNDECNVEPDTRGDNSLLQALNEWVFAHNEYELYMNWEADVSPWANKGMPTLTSPFDPLPIELTAFSAECNNASIMINWTTASEKNNDYFVLEHSVDAVNFNEIARIAGAGNSIESIDYSYTDFNANDGNNYYRLWQVDYDGTRTASEIIVASCSENFIGNPIIEVFPNPFDKDITLYLENFDKNSISIQVFDLLGKMVAEKNITMSQDDATVTLNLQNLSPATYIIRIISGATAIEKQVVKM